MKKLNNFEMQVMQALLDGENEVLSLLRRQLEKCWVSNREISDVGFFTTFHVTDEIEKLPTNKAFRFGDVHVDIPTLKNGVGFLLYVNQGQLDMLEGYTYDEVWPKEIQKFELSYENGSRDIEKLKSKWLI